jgi:hypothetical protein
LIERENTLHARHRVFILILFNFNPPPSFFSQGKRFYDDVMWPHVQVWLQQRGVSNLNIFAILME